MQTPTEQIRRLTNELDTQRERQERYIAHLTSQLKAIRSLAHAASQLNATTTESDVVRACLGIDV